MCHGSCCTLFASYAMLNVSCTVKGWRCCMYLCNGESHNTDTEIVLHHISTKQQWRQRRRHNAISYYICCKLEFGIILQCALATLQNYTIPAYAIILLLNAYDCVLFAGLVWPTLAWLVSFRFSTASRYMYGFPIRCSTHVYTAPIAYMCTVHMVKYPFSLLLCFAFSRIALDS